MGENKTAYEKLSLTWGDFTNNLRENMEIFYKENEDELQNLRNVYQSQVDNINNRMGEIFKTLSTDYEKMFRSYLERTTSFQESLGIFTLTRAQTLYAELDELKKTVKKLEEKIRKN